MIVVVYEFLCGGSLARTLSREGPTGRESESWVSRVEERVVEPARFVPRFVGGFRPQSKR